MIRARHYANDALILTKQNVIFNELGKIKIKYANRASTPTRRDKTRFASL